MFENERIYIAGPECFYKNGPELLAVMRKRAEFLGFGVTLPNDHPLDMENPDLQKRADSIFEDLKKIMKETTVIIADLEAYRGSEADSGTVYELGMAYAEGIRCYGYTRDKRSLMWKDQKYTLKKGVVYDEHGEMAPYKELPFSPTVIGSTKIIEGDFDDCLHMLMNDIEEEWKARGLSKNMRTAYADTFCQKDKTVTPERGTCPRVYLSDVIRYREDAQSAYERMKAICRQYGLEAVTPADWAENVEKTDSSNPYAAAANLTENYAELIRSCDAVIADLNDYRGYECSNDVGFECGVAFEWGKKLYGYMDNTKPCIERIPHLGKEADYRDMTGCNVENFNYPVNLMFACSMKIYEGRFEEIVRRVAEELKA